jgi:hypothetical protein
MAYDTGIFWIRAPDAPASMTLARRDFLKLSRIAALYRYA